MSNHIWKKNDYNNDIDIFAYEEGFCNGPECQKCGYSFCHHCNPEGYKDLNCDVIEGEIIKPQKVLGTPTQAKGGKG